MKNFHLDPRTKFALWLFTSICLFIFMDGIFKYLMMLVYGFLFLTAGKYRDFVRIMSTYLALFLMIHFLMPVLPHFLSFLMSMLIIAYILYPGFIGAEYMMKTVSVGEMNDAFRRMHIPENACIMTAVILRFMPVVKEETGSIRAAMKLRNIKGISKKWVKAKTC